MIVFQCVFCKKLAIQSLSILTSEFKFQKSVWNSLNFNLIFVGLSRIFENEPKPAGRLLAAAEVSWEVITDWELRWNVNTTDYSNNLKEYHATFQTDEFKFYFLKYVLMYLKQLRVLMIITGNM